MPIFKVMQNVNVCKDHSFQIWKIKCVKKKKKKKKIYSKAFTIQLNQDKKNNKNKKKLNTYDTIV